MSVIAKKRMIATYVQMPLDLVEKLEEYVSEDKNRSKAETIRTALASFLNTK